MPSSPSILVLASDPAQNSADIMVALAWLGGAAILVIIAFVIIRKVLLREDASHDLDRGFTLSDLRRLHKEGELSDEQFEAAKAALIAHGMAAMGGLSEGADEGQQAGDGLSDGGLSTDNGNSSDKSEGDSGDGRPS